MTTLDVYETDGTSRGSLQVASASWRHVHADDGFGICTVQGSVAATLLGETTVVRVNDGVADRFAFVPVQPKARRQVETESEITLAGPGVRWLLHAGQVLQEDTSDCAEPPDTRWFGWMSGDYDDSAWSLASSHGTWRSQPFDTPRPEQWPAPLAELVWSATGDVQPGDNYFRQTFTMAEEADVVVCASADDEFDLFLDGTLHLQSRGPFRWSRFEKKAMRLCAGTHTIAVRGRNLERPYGNSPAWVIFAVVEAAGDGEPAAQNQIWQVSTDATNGTFTLTVNGGVTSALDVSTVTSSDIKNAIVATGAAGADDVTVSGSGTGASPWEIEFIGSMANLAVWMSGDGSNLTDGTLTVTNAQHGGSAGVYAKSAAASTKVNAYPTTVPGLTPGKMMRLALEEAQARGTTVLDDVTLGFTDTLDSDGVVWAEINLPLHLPADIHRLMVLLEENGYDFDMNPDLTLQGWDERGSDLSATVALSEGTAGVTDVSAEVDESTVRNVIRARTDEGWFEDTDSTSITARGRWEAGLLLDGYQSEYEAKGVTGVLKVDLATPRKLTRLTIPSEAGTVPYVDFGLSDIISAPGWGTSGFTATDMRVVAITGEIDEASTVWTVEAID